MKRINIIIAIATLTLSPVLVAQTAPLTGSIGLSLAASTVSPPIGSGFDVSVGVDATAAFGTCGIGGPTVPITVGAFVLGVSYPADKVGFVSAATCPNTPSQIASPPSCNPVVNGSSGEVVCTNITTGNSSQPQGSMCVLKLTFVNNAATQASPALLSTVHDPAPRSIATNLIVNPSNCGPSRSFPRSSMSDGSVSVGAP